MLLTQGRSLGGGGRRVRGEKNKPNYQQWHAKWKLSWNMDTLRTRFCTFGSHLYAQPVLINKIFAPEISRNFIKSALSVGRESWLGDLLRHKTLLEFFSYSDFYAKVVRAQES